jgi:hypothetical protein
MRHLTRQRAEREPIDADLVLRLEEYAARALEPDPATLARGREELLRRFEFGGIAASPRRLRISTRATATLAAAVVLVAISVTTVVASSDPGEPFYGLRLAIEQLTLPSEASARAVTQIAHLEQRLSETSAAADRGDARGVTDALAAYRSQLIATIDRESGQDAGLDAVLTRHREILEALSPRLPAEVLPGLQDALTNVERARGADKAAQPGGPPTSDRSGPPHGAPGGRP